MAKIVDIIRPGLTVPCGSPVTGNEMKKTDGSNLDLQLPESGGPAYFTGPLTAMTPFNLPIGLDTNFAQGFFATTGIVNQAVTVQISDLIVGATNGMIYKHPGMNPFYLLNFEFLLENPFLAVQGAQIQSDFDGVFGIFMWANVKNAGKITGVDTFTRFDAGTP